MELFEEPERLQQIVDEYEEYFTDIFRRLKVLEEWAVNHQRESDKELR